MKMLLHLSFQSTMRITAHFTIRKHKSPTWGANRSDKLCIVSTVNPFTEHGTSSNSSCFHFQIVIGLRPLSIYSTVAWLARSGGLFPRHTHWAHIALTGRPQSPRTSLGLAWTPKSAYLPAGVLLPLLMPLTGEDIAPGPDVPLDAFLPPEPGCCCCFSIAKHKA